jgi:hypothetical protein
MAKTRALPAGSIFTDSRPLQLDPFGNSRRFLSAISLEETVTLSALKTLIPFLTLSNTADDNVILFAVGAASATSVI